MNSTSGFGLKATLVASLILSGQAFAQNLPDEINHPQYLRTYQNLEQILGQKIAEYNKLNDQKEELEKSISQMEKDQAELPVRNAELARLIDNKQQEVARLDAEIQGLEGVLGKIVEDLRRLDNIIAQLQKDVNAETNRTQTIQTRRNQVAQDLAQLNARLQREMQEENQSVQSLNKLTGEMNASLERRKAVEKERAELIRNVEKFKTELPQLKSALGQSNSNLAAKKPQLAEAQSKLPGVKAEISAEEAKLSQIDQTLSPKKAQLNALKEELGRRSPEIARLQTENKSLEQKIAANDAKISSMNVDAQIARRDSLESQIAGVKTQIKTYTETQIKLQERIKPTIGQINELTVKMREAAARRDVVEVARLKGEIAALEKSIELDQNEIKRLERESTKLSISIAARQGEINDLNTAITTAQNTIAGLRNENNSSRAKIGENDKKIQELSQANSELSQQIAALDAEVKAMESQRDPIAKKVATLKQQETQLNGQISALNGEIQRLEAENQRLSLRVAEMEKTITEFPQTMKRLEAHVRQIDEKVIELRTQIDREQRLLARIRQDRVELQKQRDGAQIVLDQVSQDLATSERLLATLQNKLNEETRNRDALVRYNQDSIRKLEGLRASKGSAEKVIADSNEEVRVNNQDIATIAQELPKLRNQLSVLTPKVKAAEQARNTAQTNASNANAQYEARLSLYQKYMTEAQLLGAEKALIGTTDGAKAGSVEAKAKANKLGGESAANEGKWEALRRGYVRGEVAGFATGFDIGIASLPDAQKGEEEGRLAGARRAKDHANMVIKPEKYLQELERRLKEDESSTMKQAKSLLVSQELKNIKAMARELQETVPDLSAEELSDAARVVSSLDEMIEQAGVEIREIRKLRKQISDARNVYSTPGAGENQNNVNCSGVYKGVKDFVEACKGSYVMRYQGLYNTAHAEAFKKDYGPAFNAQIERVFEADLSRLYPTYYKEASIVGKEVGVATGKKEIYQQKFNQAELASYNGNLPQETSRVESEAVNLVQEHLSKNAALTLKESAKLSTEDVYGISPGVTTELKMLMKNAGALASTGNSFVRINRLSGNLTAERDEAPVGTVAARSHTNLSIMKVRVNDNAVPGSLAVIGGEIIHPGNHYRSSRVETFMIESRIGINPSVDSRVMLDLTPKVSGIFGAKKHELDVHIKPKYAGVERGYETVLEEVGSNFIEVVTRPGTTEVLNRNVEKKVTFVYRLSKAARGKTVTLKVTVKNEGRAVYENTFQIKPE